jgi:hypothetical protein
MKKLVILIICIVTISLGNETYGQGRAGAARKAAQAVSKALSKKIPSPPPHKPFKLSKPSIGGIPIPKRQFRYASDMVEYCRRNNKTEKIIFEKISSNSVKAIMANMNVTEVLYFGNLFNNTFKILNYSEAKFMEIGNNIIEVTIPYYTRYGYLKSYVKFKILNSSNNRNFIKQLAKYDDPYSEFKQKFGEKDIQIVQYMQNGIIAKNNLMINEYERIGISSNTI